MSKPRFTREIAVSDEDKMSVMILPDDNTNVVLGAVGNFAYTMHPKAANDLGVTLIKAARLAALNLMYAESQTDPLRQGAIS